MTSNSHRFGLVLFFSLVAGLFSPSVSSWADDSDGSPRWCTKAKTKVEKLICEDATLGAHDQEAGVYYVTLLKMVEPSTKSDLVQSQKRWITEREQCAATAKEGEDHHDCVVIKIFQRSNVLQKYIAERNTEKRVSEFNKFKLRTFKNTAFEFQYPSSWHIEETEDGRISLKSEPEEMILGFEKTATSSKQCTYSDDGGLPADQIRANEVKVQIGGQEFEKFSRRWIPSGVDEHYYGSFNGRCFTIDISDNSARDNCNRHEFGKDQANCEIGVLEAKDLMAYSEGVFRTLRFLSGQK